MMGEDVFQLHVAISTYATRPTSLSKAKQGASLIRSSFPAGAQQDLLSLLVRKGVFPCWCAIGSSFPAGWGCRLQISHGNQTKRPLVIKHINWIDNHQMIITAKSRVERKTIVSQMIVFPQT